jgi:hypothetical protein
MPQTIASLKSLRSYTLLVMNDLMLQFCNSIFVCDLLLSIIVLFGAKETSTEQFTDQKYQNFLPFTKPDNNIFSNDFNTMCTPPHYMYMYF